MFLTNPDISWQQKRCKIGNSLPKSSTDANIQLNEGMSAVCISLAESDNVHRLDKIIVANISGR
ncbi:MAG: hypothetical protein GY796_00765 [Chloroflexi bacterium]|nr:hypothetical protein [Chloroflexota bacterium]